MVGSLICSIAENNDIANEIEYIIKKFHKVLERIAWNDTLRFLERQDERGPFHP